ncbi:MAG: STAS domain-containing protein [Candidatus Velamenicoccus archaeovorus]
MAFTIEAAADARTYRLLGELDMAVTARLLERLEPACSDRGDLVLDLDGLEFIDSSGIRALITVSRGLRAGDLVLQGPRGEVAKALGAVRAETFPGFRIVGRSS